MGVHLGTQSSVLAGEAGLGGPPSVSRPGHRATSLGRVGSVPGSVWAWLPLAVQTQTSGT